MDGMFGRSSNNKSSFFDGCNNTAGSSGESTRSKIVLGGVRYPVCTSDAVTFSEMTDPTAFIVVHRRNERRQTSTPTQPRYGRDTPTR